VRDEEQGGGASRTTDPAAGTSSATDVSLREYLTQAIDGLRSELRASVTRLETHFDELHVHQQETFSAAMVSIDKRFDGVNEFRNALADLSSLMATKDNLARAEEKSAGNVSAQSARIAAVEKRLDLREGQEVGTKLSFGVLVGVITAGVAIVSAVVVIANLLSSGGM
jgi:hypothetical protein